jgi:hypothetical protein
MAAQRNGSAAQWQRSAMAAQRNGSTALAASTRLNQAQACGLKTTCDAASMQSFVDYVLKASAHTAPAPRQSPAPRFSYG